MLKHPEENGKELKGATYAEEIDYLVHNNVRNNFICNLCDTLSGNTLVLFQLVEKHGMVLHSMMKDFDRKVFCIWWNRYTDKKIFVR